MAKDRYPSLVGKRYTRLLVTGLATPSNIGRGRRWQCVCDCGGTAVVETYRLQSGNTRSCGCLHREAAAERCRNRKLPDGAAAFNSLWYDYRYNAKSRGLYFRLSQSDFRRLISQPCSYCGLPPANVYTKHNCNGTLVYTGIDRVDNNRGYDLDNCVPCCKFCNGAKSRGSVEELTRWLAYIRRR